MAYAKGGCIFTAHVPKRKSEDVLVGIQENIMLLPSCSSEALFYLLTIHNDAGL